MIDGQEERRGFEGLDYIMFVVLCMIIYCIPYVLLLIVWINLRLS